MRLSVVMSVIMHLAFVGLVYLSLPEGWQPTLRTSPAVPIEILREAELAELLSVPEMTPDAEAAEPEDTVLPAAETDDSSTPQQNDGPDTSADSSKVAPLETPPTDSAPIVPPEDASTDGAVDPQPPVDQGDPEKSDDTIIPPKPDETAPSDTGLDFGALGNAAGSIGGGEEGPSSQPSGIPGFTQKRIGEGSKLTATDEALFKAAMAKCWNVNIGAPNPERLRVQVEFYLKKDGSLVNAPRVKNARQISLSGDPYWKAAEQAAVRAVLACAPYDLLPVERYESWQIIELNFDPSEMVGLR